MAGKETPGGTSARDDVKLSSGIVCCCLDGVLCLVGAAGSAPPLTHTHPTGAHCVCHLTGVVVCLLWGVGPPWCMHCGRQGGWAGDGLPALQDHVAGGPPGNVRIANSAVGWHLCRAGLSKNSCCCGCCSCPSTTSSSLQTYPPSTVHAFPVLSQRSGSRLGLHRCDGASIVVQE